MVRTEQAGKVGPLVIAGLGLTAILAGVFAFWPRPQVEVAEAPLPAERALGPTDAAVTVVEYSDFG